ncbi:hypothetical protein SAMN05192545_1646 [Maribacter dokdonensis]|uniref:KTSC domain-containing protein n=1 Tax=Maribacter dokdonensis TaxID=320912 RepID=A0ABY0UF32_9FLAO|nr:hypothetical protein [Maribacter dokdonensis]SDS57607.1 hypothetical protein SAMN05192545_1646 [Maribacter dokdonensis]
MKKHIFILAIIFSILNSYSQSSCDDMLRMVESQGYGTSYYSYDSDAISEVTFYEISDNNYNDYYFAIVRFTGSYEDYIYQVDSDTEFNYSMNYLISAGEAFWDYIQPYNQNLNCAPN